MSTVSVVIASHGYGHLAGHCIESVLDQTRKPDAVLFVDDGVNDCGHLPVIYPEVQFVLRPSNLGTVANFNEMLSRVKTNKVLFIGADNWMSPHCLEICLSYDADVVVPQLAITGELKRPFLNHIGIGRKAQYPVWNFGPGSNDYHGSMLYSVKLGSEVGYQAADGSTKLEEDRHLFHGMKKLGARVAYTTEPLIYYRRHRANGNRP